jgi:hypothetical protein
MQPWKAFAHAQSAGMPRGEDVIHRRTSALEGGVMPASTCKAGLFSRQPATATGAFAVAVQAVGSLALGAATAGALAIGALAIGRLAIGSARIKRLEIDELVVRRLKVVDVLDMPVDAEAKPARVDGWP